MKKLIYIINILLVVKYAYSQPQQLPSPAVYPCTTGVVTDPRTGWSALSGNSLYIPNWKQNNWSWFQPNNGDGNWSFYYNNHQSTGNNTYHLDNFFYSSNCPSYLRSICAPDNPGNAPVDWKPDYKPEDGWELIKQDFGYLKNDNSGNSVVNPSPGDINSYPYFILYNKFSAILRVVGFVKNGSNNFVKVTLIFDDANFYDEDNNLPAPNNKFGRYSGLLDFYPAGSYATMDVNNYENPMATALDQNVAVKEASVFAVHEESETEYKPFVADFQLMYDPCTCYLQKTGLSVSFSLVEQSQLSAFGASQTANGILQEPDFFASVLLDENSKTTNPDGTLNYNVSNGIIGFTSNQDMMAKFAALARSNGESGNLSDAEFAAKSLDSFSSLLDNAAGFTTLAGQEEASAFLEALSKVSAFVSLLIAPGDQGSTPQSTLQLAALSGNVTKIGSPTLVNFALPGSQTTLNVPNTYPSQNIQVNEYNNGIAETNYPMYNEVLGTFALLKTPSINFFYSFNSSNYESKYAIQFPYTSDNFQFAFNPVAKVKNYRLYGAIEIDHQEYLPVIDRLYNTQYTDQYAYDSDNDVVKYMTPFLDLSILTKIFPYGNFKGLSGFTPSVLTPYYNKIDLGFLSLTFYLKLIIPIEFDQVGTDGQNKSAILVMTYPLNVNFINTDPSVNNTAFNTFYNYIYYPPKTIPINGVTIPAYFTVSTYTQPVPNNLNINGLGINTSVKNISPWPYLNPYNMYAWSNISISGTVNYQGNVNLIAGNDIIISEESAIEGEVTMQQGLAVSQGSSVAPMSSSEISSFCNNNGSFLNNYKSNKSSVPVASRLEAVITKGSVSTNNFNPTYLAAAPNPTASTTTFYFNLMEDAVVNLYITDITGKKVSAVITGEQREVGAYQQSFNISTLAAGVYLYTLETSTGYKETQRLTVVK